MENLLKNILKSEENINPPEIVKNAFKNCFYNPLNVEWYKLSDKFEVVFYEDELEKIAIFDEEGILLEENVNLGIELLPAQVKITARKYGEIMNMIRIKRNNDILFEIIYRDNELLRYLLLIDKDGRVLKKEKL